MIGESSRPLFYLAIPPDAFATVVTGLASLGCRRQDARVVVEKPFGRDLASARALNQTLDPQSLVSGQKVKLPPPGE